jgi:hypothetical protein
MARDIELFHQLGLEPAELLGHFTSGLEFYGGFLSIASSAANSDLVTLRTKPVGLLEAAERAAGAVRIGPIT